jgi:hypothetical protein
MQLTMLLELPRHRLGWMHVWDFALLVENMYTESHLVVTIHLHP